MAKEFTTSSTGIKKSDKSNLYPDQSVKRKIYNRITNLDKYRRLLEPDWKYRDDFILLKNILKLPLPTYAFANYYLKTKKWKIDEDALNNFNFHCDFPMLVIIKENKMDDKSISFLSPRNLMEYDKIIYPKFAISVLEELKSRTSGKEAERIRGRIRRLKQNLK